jgi:hypothetical protein
MPDEKPKPGRKRAGTIIKTRGGRLQAMSTLPDGSRKRLPPFPRGTSEAMAREKAPYYTEQGRSPWPRTSGVQARRARGRRYADGSLAEGLARRSRRARSLEHAREHAALQLAHRAAH